jgi:predicted ATPase
VVCSEATARLVSGYVTVDALGSQPLKGLATPLPLYRIVGSSGAQSRLEAMRGWPLTPFVGRDTEITLLRERWGQVQDGQGQVVVLSGEAGIGKSRLVQVVREQVVGPTATQMVWQGVATHQHSPLAPVIMQWHQMLGQDVAPEAQLQHLERLLAPLPMPLVETVPLLAALLALSLPARYPPLTLAPLRQREQTLQALLLWLLHAAEQQPVLLVVEDLHWLDPSTLELLDLLITQVPTARLYVLGTCRPEFTVPWTPRAHLTQVTLGRLPPPQVAQMVTSVAGGKPLPAEVLHQVAHTTDGVPLFVEELTKMVLEADWLQEQGEHYTLTAPLPPLAIPVTIHDSLMARLDRLGAAKAVAQLGATLGRQFSYALLRAVARDEDVALQTAMAQLVNAELLYQRGVPPQATYRFKHALIQETAYQTLLRRTRRQYHQQIAQVLETRLPEAVAEQPELLARHYMKAGLSAQAVNYWQRAGQQAAERSANLEAVQHLTTALSLLATLPETSARTQQELELQVALGPVLSATKSMGSSEVEQTYARARALCQEVGATPQLFPALRGLCRFYVGRGVLTTACELGEELYRLAQRETAPTACLEAHNALGQTLFFLGEYATARRHLEQGIGLIAPEVERTLIPRDGMSPVVHCLAYGSNTLWCLGYPTQAVQWVQEALVLAEGLGHPFSLGLAQLWAICLHHQRREAAGLQAQAEALLTLATAQGFALLGGLGACWRGWSRAMQSEGVADLAQLHQGMATIVALGQEVARPRYLLLLAEATGHTGQIEDGLRLLAEARMVMEANGQGDLLAESYRLHGEFLLRLAVPDVAQAAACFQHALAIARWQQAKSWELRAAMSLARLWQQQGKRVEAQQLLGEVYGWFTEGFDTADLREAQALLAALR